MYVCIPLPQHTIGLHHSTTKTPIRHTGNLVPTPSFHGAFCFLTSKPNDQPNTGGGGTLLFGLGQKDGSLLLPLHRCTASRVGRLASRRGRRPTRSDGRGRRERRGRRRRRWPVRHPRGRTRREGRAGQESPVVATLIMKMMMTTRTTVAAATIVMRAGAFGDETPHGQGFDPGSQQVIVPQCALL